MSSYELHASDTLWFRRTYELAINEELGRSVHASELTELILQSDAMAALVELNDAEVHPLREQDCLHLVAIAAVRLQRAGAAEQRHTAAPTQVITCVTTLQRPRTGYVPGDI